MVDLQMASDGHQLRLLFWVMLAKSLGDMHTCNGRGLEKAKSGDFFVRASLGTASHIRTAQLADLSQGTSTQGHQDVVARLRHHVLQRRAISRVGPD